MDAPPPEWGPDGPPWPHPDYSRFVYAAGVRWHVQIAGSGPPVLLLHGADLTCVDSHGHSPLHLSAGSGSVACLAAILDHGGDFLLENKVSFRILFLFCFHFWQLIKTFLYVLCRTISEILRCIMLHFTDN